MLLAIPARKCQVNQISLSVNSANNQVSGWSYDAAGNALNTGAGTESYTWNAEDRMATVASTLYGDDTYTYDGNGNRVEKASGKLYWYGAGGEVLAESDASGNITDKYVFFDGERLARIDASGNVDYYLSDKLGSAAVVADSNGVKVDDCDYLPFGQMNCITSSSGNDYLYTGLERDADQLDHTLHRQYSSSFGRWMSPDPGGVKVVNMDTPQTWNLYAYVADNPTTDTDPTGLSSQYNTNGGCATLRNCNDDRQSLDHPPGQELNSGTSTNQANMLTNKTQGQTVRVMKVDINKMAAYIKAHAKAHSTGWCGRACRMAFTKGGGINAKSWPAHAGDYGPFLRAHGASVVPRKNYKAEKGDVIVFDRTSAHRSGHIEIYNGKNWDSDFSQKNMIPYSTDVPPYTIYRFPGDN